jgi:glycosyltransferase involved in cell wall biosynthesis
MARVHRAVGDDSRVDALTRRLHVLYIIDSISRSGAEESLATLAAEYQNLGVRLDVAYLHERAGLQDELRSAGAELFSLDGTGGRLGWVRRARDLIDHRHPHLVHTTLFEADVAGRVASRLARVPVVSTLANESYGAAHSSNPELNTWKLRGAQLLDAGTARLTRRLHAVSSTVANAMAGRLRYPRERIDVIPRGRNPNRLGERSVERRGAMRSKLGVEDGEPLVLSVARHEYDKGLDTLIRAMARLRGSVPNARLFVAGRHGAQTEELRTIIDRERLTGVVTLLGARSDVPDLLCAADVFVLASRREGFSGAIIEAMALEAPIVASDIAQVREALDTSSALLTAPGLVADLAAAVEQVVRTPDEAAVRARHARERFMRDFTVQAVAPRMLSFYEHALARDA